MNLMSHLIAGFPDAETSIAIADALVKGGANILEIQLAFSDPSADVHLLIDPHIYRYHAPLHILLVYHILHLYEE